MNLGRNIRKARKAAGLTQKRLSELCGVHVNTIQQYELGKREPRIEMLVRIADVFGLTVNDFVYEDPNGKIVRLRKRSRITQEEIADAMNFTSQMISLLETGGRKGSKIIRHKSLNVILRMLKEMAKERGLEEEA